MRFIIESNQTGVVEDTVAVALIDGRISRTTVSAARGIMIFVWPVIILT